jgi:hypothetical protein
VLSARLNCIVTSNKNPFNKNSSRNDTLILEKVKNLFLFNTSG